MGHPKTHGKVLLLHGNQSLTEDLPEGVPGAVAGSKDHDLCRDIFSPFQKDALYASLLDGKAGAAGPETDLASRILNSLPEGRQDDLQPVGPDVGLCVVEDLRRPPGFYKGTEDEFCPSGFISHQGIELTVRKSPGSSFSELYVGGRVQPSRFPEGLDILLPLLHRLSSLNEKRPVAVLSQQQGAEDACRPCPYDHGPFRKLSVSAGRKAVGSGPEEGHVFIPKVPDQGLFRFPAAPKGERDRIDIIKIRLFSCVQGMFFDLPGKDPVRILEAQAP